MPTLDYFVVIIIGTFVIGTFALILSYVTYTGLVLICGATSGLPTVITGNALCTNGESLALFFPNFAVLMVVVLIIESMILSFFIKAHPLAAVMAIASLFGYTIISFFVSNVAVQLARLPVFSSVIGSANLLLFFFINLPVILVVCGIVDIAISITAARQ